MQKKRIAIALCVFSLMLTACARKVIHSVPAGDVSREHRVTAPMGESPQSPEGSDVPEKTKSPGEIASIQLTDQARRFLESGDVESAIRVLERSVTLHPYNGEGYYLLAEAWILKKELDRALSFNRMALTYFKGDPAWKTRIQDQYRRISSLK